MLRILLKVTKKNLNLFRHFKFNCYSFCFLAAPEETVTGPSPTINFNDSRFRRAAVTFMTTDLKAYVQFSDQGSKVEKLQSDLHDVFSQTKPVGGHTPKKGELLAARFTGDDEWYRARVEKIEGTNRVSVYFIDYGNRELITDLSRLTTLPMGRITIENRI